MSTKTRTAKRYKCPKYPPALRKPIHVHHFPQDTNDERQRAFEQAQALREKNLRSFAEYLGIDPDQPGYLELLGVKLAEHCVPAANVVLLDQDASVPAPPRSTELAKIVERLMKDNKDWDEDKALEAVMKRDLYPNVRQRGSQIAATEAERKSRKLRSLRNRLKEGRTAIEEADRRRTQPGFASFLDLVARLR